MDFVLLLGIVFVFFGLILLSRGVKVVKQGKCMVIEKFGSYNRTISNGLSIIIPFIEKPREMYWIENQEIWSVTKVDLRERVLDVPEQAVITKDNVSINIDALMYIQITDPKRAMYETDNLPASVTQLAQTSLRNVIGEMDLDETLGSRDHINAKLKNILDDATDKWGAKINRVELKNITPPQDIQMAMEKQMQAERERRAQVLEAEGDKQSRIARSEGQKQERINLAEGEKEAQVRRAEGEAEAIREVASAKKEALEAIQSVLVDKVLTAKYLVAADYLEKFGEFTQKEGDKVFIPYESSESLGALGSIRELMKS